MSFGFFSGEEINDSVGNGSVHKARKSVAQKRRCRAKKLKSDRQASVQLELRGLEAIRGYETFHRLPVGSATLQQVMLSSAGIEGFADYAKRLDVVSVDANHDKKLCDEVIAQQDHNSNTSLCWPLAHYCMLNDRCWHLI